MSTPGNSPQKHDNPKSAEYSEKDRATVNTFFSKLEVGDLCFMNIMDYGLALFGETKAGKTTLAHHLINNPLVGNSQQAYELKSGTGRFKEAIIGHTPVSQTEIPNQITKKVKDEIQKEIEMHILDCPGYSDSKGCHMVIANGYFHYRIFSKVKNLKFVLTLDYKHFKGVFDKSVNTFIEFLMSFKKFQQIRDVVINATTLIFTKLERSGQTDEMIHSNIEAKLKDLRNCGSVEGSQQHRDDIRRLIDQVIQNKRYFFFENAQENLPAKSDSNLLQQIHNRTQFWSRKVVEQNEVDMSHIAMTLGERTRQMAKNNLKFKKDFGNLTEQFKSRFERAMLSRYNQQKYKPECSLQRITIEFLTNSIFGAQEQCSFFTDYIKEFTRVFNIYRTDQFNTKKEYEDKRAKIKNSIMRPHEAIDKAQVQCIQKLEICKLIIDMAKNKKNMLGYNIAEQRTLHSFKSLSNEVLNILVQFRKLRFFGEKQKAELDEFNYIVYRLLEQARTFRIIFQTTLNKEDKFSNLLAVPSLDITQVLYDYVQSINEESSNDYISMADPDDPDVFQKYKLTYLANHLQVSQNKPDYYYKEIEEYFDSIYYNKTIFQKSAADKLIALRMVKLNSNKVKTDKKERVLTFVSTCRILINSLVNADTMGEEYELKVEQYLESIGKLASELSKNQLKENEASFKRSIRNAINLFESTTNVYQVIESYKTLISKLRGPQLKDTLLQLADYASKHGRHELALESYQHAYACIEEAYDQKTDGYHKLRKSEREAIAWKIGMLGVERKHSPSAAYFDQLLKKKMFKLIDVSILDQIKDIYEQEEEKM